VTPATAAVAFAALLSFAPLSVYAANDANARVLRAERWLKAAFNHQPGMKDEVADEVSFWSGAELRELFVDEAVLAQLMLDPSRTNPKIAIIGRRPPPAYTSWQLSRMRVLACAASGALKSNTCVRLRADEEIDPTLKRLAKAAAAAADHGEDSFILRRGAVLHGDVAMFGLPVVPAPDAALAGDGGPIRIQVADGESTGFNPAPIHWQMARQLLDHVKPVATDNFVRRWYAATAAWMQDREQHDTNHLVHARELFPDDPDILFLSGSQMETYAGAPVQAARHSAVLLLGFTLDVPSEAVALRDAETYYRRALLHDPQRRETRIRLGHVLLARGRPQEAVDELGKTDTSDQPELLQYFHAMFLGAAEEALAHFDRARESYTRASALFPSAQSPYLALSALATRRGDRAAALRETQRLFDLPNVVRQPDDPWWIYHLSQARNVEALFERLYAPFAAEQEPR
jgi:tetratricopeptide (TPR) repeat protein